MSRLHFTDAQAEQYVLGALEPAEARALEAHASRCPFCAATLQRQALLEDQLSQVARTPAPVPTVLRPARWARPALVGGGLATATALAAGLAMLVLRPVAGPSAAGGGEPAAASGPTAAIVLPRSAVGEPPPPVVRLVSCAGVGGREEACAQQAEAQGFMVQYPVVRNVPRYEADVSVPASVLSARRFLPL